MSLDKNKVLEHLNGDRRANTLMETFNISYVDFSEENMSLSATMPVNSKVHQPLGQLHGGATAALAESVGSSLSSIFIDKENFFVNGIELNCSHLRAKRDGLVTAKATIVHKGRTLHSVDIRVVDENEKLISNCRLTNIVLPIKK